MGTLMPMDVLGCQPAGLETLAGRLRFARSRAGVSARALGRKAGLGARTVAMLEQGVRPDPRRSTIEALAKALDVKLDWLLLGKGQGPGDEASQ